MNYYNPEDFDYGEPEGARWKYWVFYALVTLFAVIGFWSLFNSIINYLY